MPITYYPNETAKKLMHVIEKQQTPDMLYSLFGTCNLTEGSLSAGVWCPKGWEVKRISLHFGSIIAKNYSVSIIHGVGIASGKNDRVWVKVDTVAAQPSVITEGFYTGATLATELTTALNACPFPTASKPFAVSYDPNDGLFTIAPNSGKAQLFTINTTAPVRRNSTASNLLGFTVDTLNAATLTSNTPVLGLGSKHIYLSESNSEKTDVLSTDLVAMTIDSMLLIEASYSEIDEQSLSSVSNEDIDMVSYEVVYRVLDA
jgi:hypothetical protein